MQEKHSEKLNKEQKSCECRVCRGACTRKPGWFMPGEAEKAARLMKMPLKKFFETYLGVDWWNGKQYGEEIFLLSPALVDGERGDLFPQNPQGRCVFYVDERCIIHKAKPIECQRFWHDARHEDGKALHKSVAMAWKDHQKQIEKLLGRKPVAPEMTMGSMLEAFFSMVGGY